MSKVSIGFSKPKKWKPLAWLIQKIEGTEYSHVFVTWHCSSIQRRKVFEAVGSGIRILSNVNFKKHAEVVDLFHFEASDEQIIQIEQETHDQTGQPYGTKAIIGLGIMRLFNVFNRLFKLKGRQGNPFKDGEYSQVCVEAAARILFKLIKLPLPEDIENYGLKEMHDLVEKHGIKVSQSKLDKINGKDSKKK